MSILVKSKIVRTEDQTKYMYISYISTCRELLYNKIANSGFCVKN